jgi:hypothetical protein
MIMGTKPSQEETLILSELQSLVDAERYGMAIKECRKILDELHQPSWLVELNLGLLYFLNAKDDGPDYNNTCPKLLQATVDKWPDEAEPRFWLGYVRTIISQDDDEARRQLRIGLALNPDHAYANLVLAGGLVKDADSIEYLRRVLEIQPRNFRALHQLAKLYLAEKKSIDACKLFETILLEKPYEERSYGIMNQYANGVLTGAYSTNRLREEARTMIDRLG